ncbi:MAG: AraC family transcriptional regulator [Spirochaetales bacterium]|nr:AraC family transcriptional regulator [Spirochaetales bacterium]
MKGLDIIPFIANISFVVSIIFFFFSLIQLIHKDKPLPNYFLSIIYFAVGIQYLSFWLYCRDSPIFERYFYYLDTAFLFLIGTFLYLFFLYIFSDNIISLKKTVLHVSPFLVTLLLIEGINLHYPSVEGIKGLLIIDVIITLSYLSLFVYMMLISKVLNAYYRKEKRSPELKSLIFIVRSSIGFSLILLLSVTLGKGLQFIGHIAFFCIPLFFIFFIIRYPAYFSNAQKESQEIRYLNSRLKGLDMETVFASLDSLMDREEIYRDSTLTLKSLGDKLNISSPQLSELLNTHYHTNFNSFINSYRIDKVKKILKEESDVNILQIAFDCGFNSKTTFNTTFRKFAGISPSKYREKERSL